MSYHSSQNIDANLARGKLSSMEKNLSNELSVIGLLKEVELDLHVGE